MTGFDKEYFIKSIRVYKKGLEEIAQEMGVTVLTVKARIKRCYQRQVWAERLITLALENEKQKEKQNEEVKVEKKSVLVDTSILLNYPESLQKSDYEIIIPTFCLHTAMRIIEGERKSNPGQAKKYEETLKKLKMKEVFLENLPYINKVVPDVKAHSIMFIKYLMKLRETKPNITCLTCSRQIKELAALNGVRL